MNTTSSSRCLALLILFSLVLAGCGTTTTVRLTGTPGTHVTGRYQADHVSSDFAGTAGWKMDFDGRRLEEFEFRKTTLEHSVDLDIHQGRKRMVHATADPGV